MSPEEKTAYEATRSRAWCFTLNNWTPLERKQIELTKCEYLVFGEEVGDKGTPHLQGYVYFASARTGRALSKTTGWARCSNRKAQGSAYQNRDYCTKESTNVFEKGDRPLTSKEKGEAEAKRWEDIKEAAKAGQIEEVDAKVYVQNYRSLKMIAQDHMPRPDNLDEVCGTWIWGDAGIGKTHLPRTKYPDAFIKQRTKWWDGYIDQETVILDDMDPFAVALGGNIKDWADKWSFMAEMKGTSKWIRPKRIIVTSQYPPEGIWKDKETLDAINRRFHVLHMTGPKFKKKCKRAPSEFLENQNVKIHKPNPPTFIEFGHDCKNHGSHSQEHQAPPVDEEKLPVEGSEEALLQQA